MDNQSQYDKNDYRGLRPTWYEKEMENIIGWTTWTITIVGMTCLHAYIKITYGNAAPLF